MPLDPLHLGELSNQVARLSERVEGLRSDFVELRAHIDKTATEVRAIERSYERITNRAMGAVGLITVLWVVVEKFLP